MSLHGDLKLKAINACEAVFYDKSVSQTVTRESLEDIKDEIDTLLDTLSEKGNGDDL